MSFATLNCNKRPLSDITNVVANGSSRDSAIDNAPGLEHPPGAYGISSENSNKCKRVRKKPSTKFFITIDLPDYYESVRKDFLAWYSEVITFCIAVEVSRVSSRVSYHLHAYLEFLTPCLLSDLREYIKTCLQINEWPTRFDVQSCRSTRNVLKYISKEDRNIFYNCKLSMLSFNYRSYMWALSVDKFSFSDPFVQEHRFCYRFLQKMFDDVKSKLVKPTGLRKCVKAYCNWSLDVCIWWNNFLKTVGFRKKQLFIYGPTSVGKSSYIETLIGKGNLCVTYFPGVGKFFMQGYKPGFHKVVVFEEFDSKYHCHSMLKRLLEGRPYAYPVKGEMDMIIQHSGPIIFVSNYYPDDFDDALKSRLLFVSATEAFWSSAEALLPKEEVDSLSQSDDEVSIFELSSDEGEEESFALHNTLSKQGYI